MQTCTRKGPGLENQETYIFKHAESTPVATWPTAHGAYIIQHAFFARSVHVHVHTLKVRAMLDA